MFYLFLFINFCLYLHLSDICCIFQLSGRFTRSNRRACSQASGLVIEHECTGDEERLVKNLGIKNYKAAAVGVTKFSPLHDKVLEETGKKIKRELKNYSKDPTNTYKYRGELEKLADFRNDHLITEIQQKHPTCIALFLRHFQGTKK